MELDQAKEKLEELTIDYQLLKEEMSEKRGDSDQNVPTSFEMRQMEQQNARLRDTLVRYTPKQSTYIFCTYILTQNIHVWCEFGKHRFIGLDASAGH